MPNQARNATVRDERGQLGGNRVKPRVRNTISRHPESVSQARVFPLAVLLANSDVCQACAEFFGRVKRALKGERGGQGLPRRRACGMFVPSFWLNQAMCPVAMTPAFELILRAQTRGHFTYVHEASLLVRMGAKLG